MPRAIPPSLREWLDEACDWRKTELGALDEWSPDLLTAVASSLPLGPVALLWGPRLIRVYGPEYAPILGFRHPAALGHPVDEEWPEAWRQIAPFIQSVQESGDIVTADVSLSINRHDFEERVYLRVTWCPIGDHDTGRILGIATTARERTHDVLQEQRWTTTNRISQVSVANRTVESVAREVIEAIGASGDDVTGGSIILAPCVPRRARGPKSTAAENTVIQGLAAPDGFGELVQRVSTCFADGCKQEGLGCRFATMDTSTPTCATAAAQSLEDACHGVPAAAECRRLTTEQGADILGRLVVALDPATRPTADQHAFLNRLGRQTSRLVVDASAQSAGREEIDNLNSALETSRTIGAAMGVLMALHKIGPDEAFTLLKQASQRANRKLRDIADDVLLTGAVPVELPEESNHSVTRVTARPVG